jgi:tetratricopeptide (TPR) repeat protein
MFFALALALALALLSGSALAQPDKEQAQYQKVQALIDRYQGEAQTIAQAEQILREMLQANPQSALAYAGLGRLTYKAGYISGDDFNPRALDKAEEFLAKAVELNPRLYDAWYYRAYNRMYGKQLNAAREFAEKARKLDPASPRTTLLFASLAVREAKPAEAVRLGLQVLETSKDNARAVDALNLLAEVYTEQKQYDLARDAYRKALEKDPESLAAQINYANFLVEYTSEFDEAIRTAEKAKTRTDHEAVRRILGLAYYGRASQLFGRKESLEEAVRLYTLALENYPAHYDSRYGLGVAYYSLGVAKKDRALVDKARQTLEEVLEIHPSHKQAKTQLEAVNRRLAGMK